MKDLSEKDYTSLLLVPKLITFLVPYHFNNVTATLTLLPNGALELYRKLFLKWIIFMFQPLLSLS